LNKFKLNPGPARAWTRISSWQHLRSVTAARRPAVSGCGVQMSDSTVLLEKKSTTISEQWVSGCIKFPFYNAQFLVVQCTFSCKYNDLCIMQSLTTNDFWTFRSEYLTQQFADCVDRLFNSSLNEHHLVGYFAESNQSDRMIHNGWLIRHLPGETVHFIEEICRFILR
jgi:hypothetical protein